MDRSTQSNSRWKEEAFWSNFRESVIRIQPYLQSLNKKCNRAKKSHREEQDQTHLRSRRRNRSFCSYSTRNLNRSRSAPPPSILCTENFRSNTAQNVSCVTTDSSFPLMPSKGDQALEPFDKRTIASHEVKANGGQTTREECPIDMCSDGIRNESDVWLRLEYQLNELKTQLAIAEAQRDEMEMEIFQMNS